jgi:hypothetical protein
MPYPWVNTLLAGFVVLALVNGYLGFSNGDPDKAWILWLHAAAAYAIVAAAAWKVAVVRRSLRVHPVIGTPRLTFVCMAALFLFVLGSGITWAHAGRILLGRIALIELHVIAAVLVAGLLAYHVVSRRWVWRIRASRDRRAFLRLVAGGAAGITIWQGASGLARLANLPGADRRFTGSYETGSFTGRFPTVSWFNDDPDGFDPDTWRLTIDGDVADDVELDLDALRALASDEVVATVDCTGGWYSTQRWAGVRMARLLELARPNERAGSIEVVSVTGFNRRFSLAEAERALLALAVAGRELSHGHGAPARLVMPDHRGFDWVKWVTRIRVHGNGDVWQPPLPLQ